MALKLKTLRDAIENRGTKLAIYGESSAGKTTQIAALLAYLGDDDKVLIITAEHGLLTLAQDQLGILDDPRILVAEVAKISEAREAVAYASTKSNGIAWVVVDSVSNIADRELRALQETRPDPRQAYGEVMLRIPGMLWALVDVAHINVMFIFQEDCEERNEGTTRNPDMVLRYSPLVPSKSLKQAMPFVFDAVLRLEVMGDKSRRFRTAKTRTIMAKDRSGTLDEFEDADGGGIGAIVAKIRAGVPAVREPLLEEDPPPDDVDHIA
jgi:hypothetical protein